MVFTQTWQLMKLSTAHDRVARGGILCPVISYAPNISASTSEFVTILAIFSVDIRYTLYRGALDNTVIYRPLFFPCKF
jgi:hypothetical protein